MAVASDADVKCASSAGEQLLLTAGVAAPAGFSADSAECHCPLCQAELRQPKLLDCLHSVCEPCIRSCLQFHGDTARVVCPRKTCQQTTIIPQGLIFALPTNLLLVRSQQTSAGLRWCNECVEREEAVSFCTDCDALLCEFHVQHHRKSRSTTRHVLESFHDKDEKGLVAARQGSLPCPLHTSEPLSLFCDLCQVLFCARCRSSHAHHSHPVSKASQVAGRKVEQLRTVLEKSRQPLRELEELKTIVNKKLDSLEDEAVLASEQISAMASRLKAVIDDTERRLLQRVADVREEREKELETNFEQLESTIAGMKLSDNFTAKVLAELSAVEQLYLLPVIRRKLAGVLADADVEMRKGSVGSPKHLLRFSLDAAVTQKLIKDIAAKLPDSLVTNSLADGALCRCFALDGQLYVETKDSSGRWTTGSASDIALRVVVRSGAGTKCLPVTIKQAPRDGLHLVSFAPSAPGVYLAEVKTQGQSKQIKIVVDGGVAHTFSASTSSACIFNQGLSLTVEDPSSRIPAAALGAAGVSSGKLHWRLKVEGFSPLYFLRLGVGKRNAMRIGGGSQGRCVWVWRIYGAPAPTDIISHDPNAHAVAHGGYPEWQDGDILSFMVDCDEQRLTMNHERTGKTASIENLQLSGDEVFPYASLKTEEHCVTFLPTLYQVTAVQE